MEIIKKCLNIEQRQQTLKEQQEACHNCSMMVHRKAVDEAEDRRNDLFIKARKKKKISEEEVDESCLKCEAKCCSDADDHSTNSLDPMFHQIHRQTKNVIESENFLERQRARQSG